MMKRFKKWLSMTMMLVTLMSSNISAFAAQEISGTTSQSTDVSVTANITSVYSVSLPATIELVPMTVDNVVYYDTKENGGTLNDNGKTISGYIAKLEMGCAGIIAPGERIGVMPVAPFYLTNNNGGQQVMVANIIPTGLTNRAIITNTQSPSSPFQMHDKNIYYWTSDTIGTCEFDGVNLSNCNYSYNYHYIGLVGEQLEIAGSFSGTMTFKFGKLTGYSEMTGNMYH